MNHLWAEMMSKLWFQLSEHFAVSCSISLRGRRFKGMRKGVLGARETREGRRGGREENACQETIVFLVFNIDQANVKILIG